MDTVEIIIGLIAFLLILNGARTFLKQFKKKGGSCCSSGSKPIEVPEKELSHVIGQKIVLVEGMTCDHCKSWVEKSINGIDGASAKVNLQKKEAIVSMEREVSDEEIIQAVTKAGFKVVEIR